MNSLKHANNLFRQSRFKEAIDLYKNIKSNRPDLAFFIDGNISLAGKRLANLNILGEVCNESLDFKKEMDLDYFSYKLSSAYAWISNECGKYINEYCEKKLDNLVTIVMPARNSAPYIVASITSLLNQSHKNIEIIVVDDFSTDETGDVVLELVRQDKRVRYVKVNANLGTYFARSYGVMLASGDYVTFQDADDFSHENRIEIQLHKAISTNAFVVTTNYVRFDLGSGKIIEFHGRDQHYGFITTFVKRSLFAEIGSFDLTTRGGDAEFSFRLARHLNKSDVQHITFSTYLASDMPGSLSYGEIDRAAKEKKVALSFSRARYSNNFHNIGQTFLKNQLAELFRFPMLRSPYNLPKSFNQANIGNYKIVGCVCTIPERYKIFQQSFSSIENQVDILYVYPDKYLDDEIPQYIRNSKKVKIISRNDYPGLRDGAKFLPMQVGLLDGELNRTIIFTFDDDILYPPDYVHSLFNRLLNIGFSGVVGVHGAILKENFENFRTDRSVFSFKHLLKEDTLVDVLGTGTVAFKADLLKTRFLAEDLNPGFIDISLAVVCRRNAIPLHCVSRPGNWLRDLTAGEDTPSLWDELVQDATPHTTNLKKIGIEIWGEYAIRELFLNRKVTVFGNDVIFSKTLSLSKIENSPSVLRVELERDFIYKISIHVESVNSVTGYVSLVSTISGAVIYRRQPIDNRVSFLCNGAINKYVSIDISELILETPDPVITFFAEAMFDASMPKSMTVNDKSITACVATYPPRENCFEDVVNNVLPQVDNFCCYLNRYSSLPKSISETLSDDEKSRGLSFIIDNGGQPKASGKFRWLNKQGYIFTLDDDILYPDNYFSHLIGWIEKYKRRAFVGVHGVIFNSEVKSFHTGLGSSILKKINFSNGLSEATRVHLIGTGTLAFHSSLIDKFRDELFNLMNFRSGYENANDESLAVFCNAKKLPMYLVPRKEGWLKSNKNMKYGIYEEHFNDGDLSDSVVNLLKSGNPWVDLV